MKISLNWLRQYIDCDMEPAQIAEILTLCGLEVESIAPWESVRGCLTGLVVGEVKQKQKHPDADKLSLARVDVATGELLNIVCGAPNLEEGQKVVVALTGSVIYPVKGGELTIRKTKIRGQESQGMICAEDEIGLGPSHDSIIVLSPAARTGSAVSEIFQVEKDIAFEIGLTPNRSDAASHIGVARDLLAALKVRFPKYDNKKLIIPTVDNYFQDDHDTDADICVEVQDNAACPRYSCVSISGLKVTSSPQWLQNRLKSIGLKPVNNVVDITNYVLHETGQPLHAFDAMTITGNKIIVKKLPEETPFITLDGVERKLSSDDLMICNAQEAMCIAGVLGGMKHGITEKTNSVLIESAYFSPSGIRKTAKRHSINTDAAFRFSRGTDPNMTIYALKRVALLMKEIAGGRIISEIKDIYPVPVKEHSIKFNYDLCDRLAGQKIEKETTKQILSALEIKIINETPDELELLVPPAKTDVCRQEDVTEEILRIYGYNKISLSQNSYISFTEEEPLSTKRKVATNFLTSIGFYEILTNSLTRKEYYTGMVASAPLSDHPAPGSGQLVQLENPVVSELNCMRQTLLNGGLEVINHNQNRQIYDLKLFEFGKTYRKVDSGFDERLEMSLLISGNEHAESWRNKETAADYFYIKGVVTALLSRIGIDNTSLIADTGIDAPFSYGIRYKIQGKDIATFGALRKDILKTFDLRRDVYFAEFFWDNMLQFLNPYTLRYKEVPRFPSVRRDLSLLIKNNISYSEVQSLALKAGKGILEKVGIFDVYQGDGIESGKKSYTLSFIFRDPAKTLTDGQVDKLMEKIMRSFKEQMGAIIR